MHDTSTSSAPLRSFVFPPHALMGRLRLLEGTFQDHHRHPRIIQREKPLYAVQGGWAWHVRSAAGTTGRFPARQLIETRHNHPKPDQRIAIVMEEWEEILGTGLLAKGFDLIVLAGDRFDATRLAIAHNLYPCMIARTREAFYASVERLREGKSQKAFWDRIVLDAQGCTDWFADDVLRGLGKEGVLGNGNTVNRTGTVWRDYLIIHTVYRNGKERLDIPGVETQTRNAPATEDDDDFTGGTGLLRQRFCGFTPLSLPKQHIPQEIRDALMGKDGKEGRSVVSGSSSQIEIDHKEGRAQQHGFSDGRDIAHYQLLTQHENKQKRNRCAACRRTNLRCNATTERGLPVAFTIGDDSFDRNGLGCKGCILYDVAGFYKGMAAQIASGAQQPYKEPAYGTPRIAAYTAPTTIWPGETGWEEQLRGYLLDLITN